MIMVDPQALQPWWSGVRKQRCQRPTMSATAATIVRIYLSILHLFWIISCFSYNYSLKHVCLFHSSIVFYQHQQHWHALYQLLCHHDVLSTSKCSWNTTVAAATTTGTRSDNGNHDILTNVQLWPKQPAALVNKTQTTAAQQATWPCRMPVMPTNVLPSKCNRNTTSAATTTGT